MISLFKYILIVVVCIFIYLLLVRHPNVHIRNNKHHIHCRTQNINDSNNTHEHIDLNVDMFGHNHDSPHKTTEYVPGLLYTAGYDIQLEYILKFFVICVVTTCTVIAYNYLP